MASAEKKNKKFWRDCERGDLEAVKKAIKTGEVDLNWHSPKEGYKSCTPLHIAVMCGHEHVVVELLCSGANPNTRNTSRSSPLNTAARRGDAKIVKLLLKWKADRDTQDTKGETALHKAAKYSNLEMLEMLLEAQAPIDKQNNDGNTPLHLAAMEGHPLIVQHLLKSKANASIRNNDGLTAYEVAVKEIQTVTVSMFPKDNQSKDQIIWDACCSGDLETVEEYVDQVDLDWENPQYGCTMLHITAEYGHEQVVLELLRKGASTDIASKRGDTPLTVAAKNGDKAIVQHLIDYKAKLDTFKLDGNTALHIAVYHCHMDVVAKLVTAEAPLDVQNNDGNTPLHIASENGHTDAMRLLLCKGARRDMSNKEGKTPRQVAEDAGNCVTLNLFDKPTKGECREVQSSYASSGPSNTVEQMKEEQLWSACYTGDIDLVKMLIDEGGVNLNWQKPCTSDCTPILIATMYGHEAVVDELLEAGADPNIINDAGLTPLMKASMQGDTSIAKFLLNKNANMDAVDQREESALHKAAKRAHKKVVELLVEKNANLELKDKKGNTPLHYAAEYGQTAVVKYLVEKGAIKSARNNNGKTAEELAAEDLVTLDALKGQAQQENTKLSELKALTEEQLSSVLWKVSLSGHLQSVEDILSMKKANPNWKNPLMLGYTTLQIALMYDHTDVMSILLENGADPKLFSEQGTPALLLAAKNCGVEACRLLLNYGAKIDTIDTDGNTALHMAVMRSHTDLVELLCEKGATVNAARKDGDTPLHLAARKDNPHITLLLLDYGANKYLKNTEGKAPYDIATHLMVIEQLFTGGGEGRPRQRSNIEKTERRQNELEKLLQRERAQVQEKEEEVTALKGEVEKYRMQVEQLQQKLDGYRPFKSVSAPLPAVEVFAETGFEVSAKGSPLTYPWDGHGLRLQLPEGTTSRFSIKAVWSSKFKLPKGTELVSPVYLVSSEGEVGGLVGVELQHCARMREEGQRCGLRFAVCKVEKAEPRYCFELYKGQFWSSSSYGKMELKFSSKLVAIVRYIQQKMGWGPTVDPMFQAKLYYQQQQSTTLVHFVIVPHLDISTKMLQQYENSAEYLPGPSEVVVFEKETISLQFEGFSNPLEKSIEKGGWRMTPHNTMEVTRKSVTNFASSSNVNARLVQMKWVGEGKPQDLEQKVVLNGSEGCKFFMICVPPTSSAPAAVPKKKSVGRCQLLWKVICSCRGAGILSLLLALSFAVFHPLPSFSCPFHTNNQNFLIPSDSSLIQELPVITDPVGFCMCLKISLPCCQQIRSNYQGNLKDQTTQIAAIWYRESTEPSWDMVVEALFCFQRNRDAVQLAKKMGVAWKPLQKKIS